MIKTRHFLVLAAFVIVIAIGSTVHAMKSEKGVAIFSGGCFWCVESDFDKVPGVLETISGYTGGTQNNPTYKTVTAGGSGHYEAVKIFYDPKKISYEKLLHVFWRSVDPTDDGGQFCDRGHSYKTAIFAKGDEQLKIANASKKVIGKAKLLKDPIVTPILKAGPFFRAEEYHQDFHNKSAVRYNYYRYSCGRNARVKSLWGKEAYSGIPKKK
jgi:peptide-methionine (S)-S-oxide reductase